MSYEWYRRANESIAQGALTNSKRVETLIKGVSPTHVTHGEGAYLYTPDGRKYVDYICGLGTNLFGYANPHITKAISERLSKGWLYSLGSTLEVECAELLKSQMPFVQKVRFLKTGTEACAAAVRIARAHTGRDKVLSSGYHGWADEFVSLSPPGLGIPKRLSIESFTSLDQLRTDVAALIIEPIMTEHSPKRIEWLQLVVDKCRKNSIVVIFDEIITGFRWPRMSFSADSGIHPDIILLGKAISSGMPLAAVGLARGIGDDKEWFVSGTYAGELLSLSVMKKTIELLHNKYKIDELWRDGACFQRDFNEIHPKLQIEGYPTRGVFVGDPEVKALFWQEAHRAGILFGPSFFYGFQHIGMREQVITSCKAILQRIKNNEVKLEGEPPTSPFAQRVRAS